MGLFNFLKDDTPPPLYLHRELGEGKHFLSPLPSETHPSIHQGSYSKSIKKRVKEEVDTRKHLAWRQAQMDKSDRAEQRILQRLERNGHFGGRGGFPGELPGDRRDRAGGMPGGRGMMDEARGMGRDEQMDPDMYAPRDGRGGPFMMRGGRRGRDGRDGEMRRGLGGLDDAAGRHVHWQRGPDQERGQGDGRDVPQGFGRRNKHSAWNMN
jgi:hypothetical protein